MILKAVFLYQGVISTPYKSHLKNRILVQDRGGAEFSRVAGFPA